MGESEFAKQLRELINKNSMENGSNTPDFILAEYLDRRLSSFDLAVMRREHYYGRGIGSEFNATGEQSK